MASSHFLTQNSPLFENNLPSTLQHRLCYNREGYFTNTQRSFFMSETLEGERQPLPMKGVPQPTRKEVLKLPRVHISTHPVMQHKMTALRDKNTPPPAFYRLVKEIGALLAYEATAELRLEAEQIETPLQPMKGQRLAGGIAITP